MPKCRASNAKPNSTNKRGQNKKPSTRTFAGCRCDFFVGSRNTSRTTNGTNHFRQPTRADRTPTTPSRDIIMRLAAPSPNHKRRRSSKRPTARSYSSPGRCHWRWIFPLSSSSPVGRHERGSIAPPGMIFLPCYPLRSDSISASLAR